ncbi:lysylphosphatidylglycerol synthase transmembrane domain-containing protein [Nitrosophilus kaiyonis]|uniref:lysylphosphatidylglycerol synthase transmembrane domain-containing protein n=1 Tax=Nitrosophilus kaiyonis TaxID=2930200 RepID=UPI002491AB2F|nr:lysylphosphatidylglycerol synthase transmembrane domain-containing protein [Nitrosophilus kaiyonis]
MDNSHLKKRVKTFFKIVFSLLLLFFVLSQIDTSRLFEILKKSNVYYLFLAFIFFNLSKIISSIRLNYYFKEIGINLSEIKNLTLYYLGMFYNLFLPGGIGGDGYKIYILRKRFNTPAILLIQATLLDRISGLIALIFLAGVLFYFSSFAEIFEPLKFLSIIIAFIIYPIFLYLHKKLFKNFLTYLDKTTFLGFIVQSLQLICAFFIIKSLPDSVNYIDFLTLFLISSVVAVLPITIGGVGARELTFLYGLKLINTDPSVGIAFSFIFFLITMISSAIGIFFIHRY